MKHLKMLTTEEVSEVLNTSHVSVTMMRELGIIKATKTGRNYMFSQRTIEQFQEEYAGLDVSNKVKAIESMKIIQQKKAQQELDQKKINA